MSRWIRRLRCSWMNHPLTERVMEFVDTDSPTVTKTGSWIPVSSELFADVTPFSPYYSLRCQCGQVTDSTIRTLLGDFYEWQATQ